MSTTYNAKPKIYLTTWKFGNACMDCHRLASWPTKRLVYGSTITLIKFTVVVDDFGIKYINKRDAEHLLIALKDHYKVEIY
ncbi:hypothetical protein ACHAXS_011400 [Conticribra weissflogii]